MRIVVAKDRITMGRYTAEKAATHLRQCLSQKTECNLVIATGSSQFEVLDSLVSQPDIDWSRVNGFHLDEYLGIDRSHSASFCGYLAKRVVDRVPLKSFFYLDGTKLPELLRSQASEQLAARTIDLLLCGIGENGHLAFNDPPADFATQEPYLIVELDEACRRQQVGEGWFDSLDQVPTQAISMSIHQILKADKILCSVPDQRKAEAVRNTVEGELSPQVPASALKQHADVTLVLDAASATLLSKSTNVLESV
ncbi:MAG: glucosamine-6-phosphate deaminase [Pirellulaceae bacterium]|nr:glucosamine-6-phosphate deaminase [Pirellulaceae bacterium]